MNAEFDTGAYRYSYQSPITPNSTFEYDVADQTSTLLKQQEVPGLRQVALHSGAALCSREGRNWYPRHRRVSQGQIQNGRQSPFRIWIRILWSHDADTFSANLLPLLDRGVVTTVAHIRGGGELGEAWHDAGKMMTKRNTFTDFIDATEGLLAKGYGKPGLVGIEGGSAGGLLMGAVTNCDRISSKSYFARFRSSTSSTQCSMQASHLRCRSTKNGGILPEAGFRLHAHLFSLR